MFSAWISSFRLKTLPLALATILVGSSLAYWQQHFNILIFVFTLLTAITLQILSNLANDYGDAQKGADDSDRIGPLRGIQTGQISLSALKNGLIICTLCTIIFGSILLYIAIRSSQDLFIFLLLGCISILAAITYTVGKKPYGYLGLGDLSVFIFFGLVAVMGSLYLQTSTFYAPALLPACAFGFLSAAVLNINNLRDYKSDKKHHKRTLVVLIGPKKACYYHAALLLGAFLTLVLFEVIYAKNYFGFLLLTLLPFAYRHLISVFKNKESEKIGNQLVVIVKMTLACALLFCLNMIFN